MSKYAKKNFGIAPANLEYLKKLDKEKKLIVVLFGSPYALRYFQDFSNVVVAYEEDEMAQQIAAQSLMGAFAIKGKLPITASPKHKFGDGIYRPTLGRW